MTAATALPLLAIDHVLEVDDEAEPGARYFVFSATQVDTFLDCPRKWAWDKIARLRRPEQKGAQVGTACHAQQEKYLRGEPYDFTEELHGVKIADVCTTAIPYLPDPRDVDPNLIETEFRWQSAGAGFVYTGRIDLELPDSGVIPGLAEEKGLDVDEAGRTGVPAAVDHKFLGSLGYAKDEEDLEWDVQASLYAYNLVQKWRSKLADLVWVNAQTRGGKSARRVHLRVTRDSAVQKFRLIEGVAKEMAAIRERAPSWSSAPEPGVEGPPDVGEEWRAAMSTFVKTLAKNVSACRKFGGCAYRHACGLTPEEEIEADMMSDDDVFDSLRKRAQAQDGVNGATPAPAPPPPPPMPAPPPPQPAASAGFDLMSLMKTPHAVSAPTTPDTDPAPSVMGVADTDVPAPTDLPPWAKGEEPPPPAINPPESTLPPPVDLPLPETSKVEPPKEEKPRRGGRGKKAKEDAAQAAREVCETPAAFTQELEALKPPPELSFELSIDCFPSTPFRYLEAYLERAKELVSERASADPELGPVADWRFIPFGKGAGALAVATVAALREEPPAHLVVRTGTDEVRAVLTSLVPFASRIHQGF